ncbi:unnamed protein product [Prorocentrum cordatum]|uniref:DUF913 domain-containing protein n=1 Tax=Prorocentrum cordatum TaxID=2364126 RepID=A0ABN9PZV8_9DINO|nr:unnamed protein product [Polarella glacialis]
MVRLGEDAPALAPEPPHSQQLVIERLSSCSDEELLVELRSLRRQHWERCPAARWHPVLNRFDALLAAYAEPKQRDAASADAEQLVCEVLRVLCDVLFQHPELKGAFASGDRLRDLLECPRLPVVLGALRCLSACPPGRLLRGSAGVAAQRRLEALAGGADWAGGLRGACRPGCPARDFLCEVPRAASSGGGGGGLTVVSAPASSAESDEDAVMNEILARCDVAEAHRAGLRLQLSMWRHGVTAQGRREVVALSLYALCNAVRHLGPGFLQQHLQRRPGLFSELCDLLQDLEAVGPEVGVAALRATGAILDSRSGPSRTEASQLSQLLGLSVPHGIVSCALRRLLGEQPVPDAVESHRRVLLAALELFQVMTSWNHQATAQLGHAGMILAMLDLASKTDLPTLPAAAAALRCLELAAEASESTALVLFRELRGLEAFSARLRQEVELLLALDFTGDVYCQTPPGLQAPVEDRDRYWRTLEEVTARRKLCRQLLKNIRVALQCSEVFQSGMTTASLVEVLKRILQEPEKVGLSIFGTAVEIVSALIQDDPSRVPQMIESGVLPGIVGVLRKDTLRCPECLAAVPDALGAITLHAAGVDFVLKAETQPIKLLIDVVVDPSFAPMLHSQPELVQILSTHLDKVIRNRPAGSAKLPEHVVECMLETMRALLEQAKAYPPWSPLELAESAEFLADRLASLGRLCWHVLGASEEMLSLFLEKQGLGLVYALHRLPCLPYHLCSSEGGQQHPLGSLFSMRCGGQSCHAKALPVLSERLEEPYAKVSATLRERLREPCDLAGALAKMEAGEIDEFLRALSSVAGIAEGLLSICRDGASTQVLEALREPLEKIGSLAPALLAIDATRSRSGPPRAPPRAATATYNELARSLFEAPPPPAAGAPSAGPGRMEVDAGGAAPALASGACAAPAGDARSDAAGAAAEAAQEAPRAGGAPGAAPPWLHVARQCFRLSARSVRNLLGAVSKQLHGRARATEAAQVGTGGGRPSVPQDRRALEGGPQGPPRGAQRLRFGAHRGWIRGRCDTSLRVRRPGGTFGPSQGRGRVRGNDRGHAVEPRYKIEVGSGRVP